VQWRGIGGSAGYGTVLSRDNGSNRWIFLSRDAVSFAGKLSLNIFDGSTNPGARSNQTLSIGVLYHVGFTISGNTATVFVNGIADGSGSVSGWLRPTLTGVQLGRWGASGGGRPMDGFLGECRLYNRALTAVEFRILASRHGISYELAPRRRSRIFTGGFKAYWAARKAQIIGGGL
jgi:hypothetical protein